MNYAIIAAGEGSRLREEGVAEPKPLVKLHGRTLLDRLISVFLQNNATSISIIVNEEMVEVQEYVKHIQLPIPFNLLVRSTPSSMHSFFELSRFLHSGKFCLTTVDTIFKEEDFAQYIRAFEKNTDHEGMMAVTDFIDDEKPLYVGVDANKTITGFFDSNKDENCRFISGGIYGLSPRALDTLKSCMDAGVHRMRNYQRQLIADGYPLKAYPFSKILDVDHAKDIQVAEAFLRN